MVSTIPDIENQIIKLLHIGEILQYARTCKSANQKIINLDCYKWAKLFYNINSVYIPRDYAVYEQYFLNACKAGLLEIIRYLFEKYDLTNILKRGYEEILKTNNLKLIQNFSREFGSYNPESLDPYIRASLSPRIIEYIFGPNIIIFNQTDFIIACKSNNFELITNIYSNFSLDFVYSEIRSIKESRWLINNCKIDSTVIKYSNISPFIWLYYDSKNNGTKYSNPDDQFLIILGKIIFENKNPSLLEELFPVKNQLDQPTIAFIIDYLYCEREYNLTKYLIKYFLENQKFLSDLCGYFRISDILDCLLEKLGNNLEFLPDKLYSNKFLIEKLIIKNKIPNKILTQEALIAAANTNNHPLLKYILEKGWLNLSKKNKIKIKKELKLFTITTAKTVEILIHADLFDFEDIKEGYINNIFQDWVYGTDLLAIILREIKKSDYKLDINLQKLFNLTCTISKNQAELLLENHRDFIQLTKNQMVWLGIIQN